MPRKKVCDMDCLHCKYDDCINDYVEPHYESEEWKNRSEEHKARVLNKKKKIYNTRKSQGLCARCGKNPVTYGTLCNKCRLYYKKHHRETYVKKYYGESDKCVRCGGERMQGHKLCKRCYDVSCNNLEKARNSPKYKEAQEILKRKIWAESRRNK